uniref:HD protein 4 n=1 Tax=Auricularia cornea TaxID=1238391 RepID=A0A8K2AUU1_9AGAM|nr:HD protein 4 [Auricularia cornea]
MDIFNDAQLAKMEDEFQWARQSGELRPPRYRMLSIAGQVSDLGPEVSSQLVGKWFANRSKDEDGKPRLQWKTPEQVAILEESFANDPYPDDEEVLRLIRTTLLSKKQVTSWFCTQRKKNPEIIEERYRQDQLILAMVSAGYQMEVLNTRPTARFWKEVEEERLETLRLLEEEAYAMEQGGLLSVDP